MLDGFLLRQIEPKFVQKVLMNVAMLDVGNVRVHHQRDQVDDQIRMLPEDRESRVAEPIEPLVVRRLRPAHRLDHLFAELYGRREGLWIAPENVPEIDVKEVSVRRE